jgi:hypothetical protein
MPISRRDLMKSGVALPPLAISPAMSRPGHSFAPFLRDDNDLTLSGWGPYSPRYAGISHVADRARGLRFDLSVFPGLYRRKLSVPTARIESGYYPWESSPEMDYYCYRHEVEWKDQVYCDVSYSRISDHARLIRADCVNRTNRHQNLVLHYIASLSYPTPGYEVALPAGATWLHALDYTGLTYATPRPTDNLVYAGLLRGEARDPGYTGGYGIGKNFGREKGDRLDYQYTLNQPLGDAVLLVRARLPKGSTLATSVGTLAGTGEFTLTQVPLGSLAGGRHEFSLVSQGGAAIELDGFVVAPAATADAVRFSPAPQDLVPEHIIEGPRRSSVLLKYRTLDTWYGLAWNYDMFQTRQFFYDDLDIALRSNLHNHTTLVFRGPGQGHFTNAFLRPIPLEPNSNRPIHGIVCQGSREEAAGILGEFPTDAAGHESRYEAARRKRVVVSGNPEGQRYEFAQNRMAAANCTNLAFPLYLRRHFVRHNTPTPWAPMLYTWDAGFTGLGLLELDADRAVGCLNTYLTRPGDKQAAFMHYGTPLPVQIFLFLELWNRTRSRELLEHFYPRVRQYHMFLAGRLGSSSTRRLKSQLLQTWDYFYNTGWDDYPPQSYMHAKKLHKTTAAVTTTAHAIRTARILSMAARALGRTEDLPVYDQDIAIWTEALQRHSWDEEAGYFGYVCHDGAGNPTGILRHPSGVNFNMGMCGAYPLFAGVCTPAQEKRILGHMMSDRHLWTKIGMTSVDQSAPYYTPDGYWNGAVWMPHQWFVWKSLLDLGYGNEAYRIASTGLDVWSREVNDSYLCLEHFMVQSGRGAGLHHMTGLSNPVLCWFNAYYRPGRLTAGFDSWIEEQHSADGHSRMEATIRLYGAAGRRALVLAVMRPGGRYRATWAGREVTPRVLPSGALELALENLPGANKLAIGPV